MEHQSFYNSVSSFHSQSESDPGDSGRKNYEGVVKVGNGGNDSVSQGKTRLKKSEEGFISKSTNKELAESIFKSSEEDINPTALEYKQVNKKHQREAQNNNLNHNYSKYDTIIEDHNTSKENTRNNSRHEKSRFFRKQGYSSNKQSSNSHSINIENNSNIKSSNFLNQLSFKRQESIVLNRTNSNLRNPKSLKNPEKLKRNRRPSIVPENSEEGLFESQDFGYNEDKKVKVFIPSPKKKPKTRPRGRSRGRGRGVRRDTLMQRIQTRYNNQGTRVIDQKNFNNDSVNRRVNKIIRAESIRASNQKLIGRMRIKLQLLSLMKKNKSQKQSLYITPNQTNLQLSSLMVINKKNYIKDRIQEHQNFVDTQDFKSLVKLGNNYLKNFKKDEKEMVTFLHYKLLDVENQSKKEAIKAGKELKSILNVKHDYYSLTKEPQLLTREEIFNQINKSQNKAIELKKNGLKFNDRKIELRNSSNLTCRNLKIQPRYLKYVHKKREEFDLEVSSVKGNSKYMKAIKSSALEFVSNFGLTSLKVS